ncbi:TetR/AcrR family transcriptional regulator [Bacillus sp. FJAT-29814]|uniref:TetR/AcrR family transcriptional regulator n=1 Tax=Bacillus sp. FJAT-29814 TaxID=1729688 RepID=UPI00082D4F19|nr:TetR/AcrR family transcriptional regulator [Bacillus sp. FJAT-29814]
MRREQNKEYTRNLLITSAIELFKQQEYQKTTIDEIAKKAGVSKPTFFAYFRSKEQILYEFDLQQLEAFELYMKEQLNSQGDLFANLREGIMHMATNLHSTNVLTQNLMHLVTISADYKQLLMRMSTIFQSITKDVLEFGQENQMVTMNIPADEIARDIFNIYLGGLVSWVISNGEDSLEVLIGSALEHYFTGIKIV